MAEDDEFGPGIGDHRGGNIAGEGAAIGVVTILRAHSDLFSLSVNRVDQRVRRRNRHLDFHVSLGCTVNRTRFGQHRTGAMHLPVSDNIGSAGHGFVVHLAK